MQSSDSPAGRGTGHRFGVGRSHTENTYGVVDTAGEFAPIGSFTTFKAAQALAIDFESNPPISYEDADKRAAEYGDKPP